jgi:hypothetical protein
MFTRYLSSPLLGVVELYLMLGSLLGIFSSPLLGVVELYLMLGSLLGICLVHSGKHPNIRYKSTTPSSGLNKYLVNFLT